MRSFAVSLLALGVLAQQPMDNSLYPEFAAAMATMDERLTWEAYEVTSDTGYVKTLFHITGMKGWDDYAPWRQPILVLNGAGTNVWTYIYDEGVEAFSQLVAGFDPETFAPIARSLDDVCGEFVAAFQDNTIPSEVVAILKDEFRDVWNHLSDKLTEAGTDDSTSTSDDDLCVADKWRDMARVYNALLTKGDEASYNDLSESIPSMLFWEGYDIWLDGNRGTEYQKGHTNANISDADYWDFSFHQMALEDMLAEVDFVVDMTGVDQISYIGYSMSTAQMLQAIGMQSTSSRYSNTLAKVDVALLMAPCPWSAGLPFTYGLDATEAKKQTANYLQAYENSEVYFQGGPDTNIEGVLEIECQFYDELTCALFAGYLSQGRPVSQKAFLQYVQNGSEAAMLTDYFPKYGKNKYPTSKNYIDFTTVTGGPKVYGFGFSGDATCPWSGPVSIAESLPTFEKLTDYQCFGYGQDPADPFAPFDPHLIPMIRGQGQTSITNMMIDTLKENRDTLSAPLKIPVTVRPDYDEHVDINTLDFSGASSGISALAFSTLALGAMILQ